MSNRNIRPGVDLFEDMVTDYKIDAKIESPMYHTVNAKDIIDFKARIEVLESFLMRCLSDVDRHEFLHILSSLRRPY